MARVLLLILALAMEVVVLLLVVLVLEAWLLLDLSRAAVAGAYGVTL